MKQQPTTKSPARTAFALSTADKDIHIGDIVVTALSGKYVIGRVIEDGNRRQDVLAYEPTCNGALESACHIVDSDHKVFLYWNPGTNAHRILPEHFITTPATATHTPGQSAELGLAALRQRGK